MKHTFRTLLGLVLVVFVLAGCSSPVGPEFSEIDKTTLEKNVKYVEVNFEWSKNPEITNFHDENYFKIYGPLYLLSVHPNSRFDGYEYAYDFPEEYTEAYYTDLLKKGNEEKFKEFFDEAFRSVFSTTHYKEGDIIDLTQWTSKAINLRNTKYADCLRFSTKDIDETEELNFKNTVEVGGTNMVIYVFWDAGYSDIKN